MLFRSLLIKKNAVAALRALLMPLAAVATPNIPEAEELTGLQLRCPEDIKEAARQIVAMGAKAVVIKGGHLKGPAIDLFFDGEKFADLSAPRVRFQAADKPPAANTIAMAEYPYH